MTWIKFILILIILYLVCSARTCNEDEEVAAKREEQGIMNLVDSVKHVFMSDSLSDQLLRAYEITATEKLNDFTGYMKIIADTSLDMRFRQHATRLVKSLFISDEIELLNLSKVYPEIYINNLEQLLTYSLSEGIPYWINPMQIDISKPFTRVNDSTFTGNLSFNYKLVFLNSQDTSVIASGKLVIDIYLIKMLNSFGNDEFRVWGVYLGDINQDELTDKRSMPQL